MVFSIVMAAFNAEHTVSDSIVSVLHQSFSEWELIVVDDGSVDGTREIVGALKNTDCRISSVCNNRGKGVSGARNTGIELAKGRYICFLDSDDLWANSKLINQYNYLQKNDVPFIYSNYYAFKSHEKPECGTLFVAPDVVDYQRMLKTCSIGCLTAVYDSLYFGKVYFPEMPKEDYALWLNLLRECGSAYNTGGADAFYRLQNKSLSSNKLKELLRQYNVLRSQGNLSIVKIAYLLFHYVINGIRKYG